MLNAEAKAHFEAFGYLVVRDLFASREVDEFSREHKEDNVMG